MKCHLVYVTHRGYKRHSTFEAADLREACAKHVAAWTDRMLSAAIVMRLPSGVRHSFNASSAALAA